MPIHPAAAVLQSSRFFIAPRPPALDARLSTTLQVLQVLNQVQVSVKVSECTSRVRQAFPGKPFLFRKEITHTSEGGRDDRGVPDHAAE